MYFSVQKTSVVWLVVVVKITICNTLSSILLFN